MKIGVTGTREGMTPYQANEVQAVLNGIMIMCQLDNITPELHHGDCRGVDVEAAAIAKEIGYIIVCHPPKSTEQQGFFGGDEVREPAGYLQRDRAIVDSTDSLLVVPLQMTWQPRGGTWYTHDYAVKRDKVVTMFYPSELV